MNLKKDQLEFLNRHQINLDRVFDASTLSRAEYSRIMKRDGYDLAFGVSACKKMGHSLRNSSGHCVQCNPSYLAYRSNYNDSSWLYIAESLEGNLIKIGTSRNVETRGKSLNDQFYAGFYDWRVVYSVYINGKAGAIEKLLHELLSHRYSEQTYIKDGRSQKANETFEFAASEAIVLVQAILKPKCD